MTTGEFRRMALALPGASESAHHDHPDFRVGGRIFATLGFRGDSQGMVRLPLDEQRRLVTSDPDAFEPAKGAWGRQGCTIVHLEAAKKSTVKKAIATAWEERRKR